MSIIVYDDPDKLALITYPDLALNCKCSQFIFFYLLSLVSRLYLYFTFCSRICLSSFLGYIMIALFVYIWKYDSIFYLCIGADMSCFQGLFFCPEAASLLLHNFCIYHISPPGHEVCKLVDLNVFFIAFRTKYYYSYSFPSETSTRVLEVGSKCNLCRGSCSFS